MLSTSSATTPATTAKPTASLRRFIGNNAYDTTALRTDLARFQFLLGGDTASLGSPRPAHTESTGAGCSMACLAPVPAKIRRLVLGG